MPVPSTYNPEGISYQVQEVEAGGADATAITPNTFVANGHLGETISVVIINNFASVTIDKSVSATIVVPGQELNYDLVVQNTGALALGPVVVDDLLPSKITYVGYEIPGNAGTCSVDGANKPQRVTCTFAGPLAPGATLPTITLLVTVDNNISVGDSIVNQARVRGTYTPEFSLPSDARLTLAEDDSLSCVPTENEVCDLSAAVGVTVGVAAPTTTVAATTTTTEVASQAPTTTVAIELPKTGSGSTSTTLWIAFLLLAVGITATAATRPKRTI